MIRRLAVLLAVSAIVAGACGSDQESAAPMNPTFRVCVDPLGKPLEFEDPENPGEFLGMSVQLIEEIARREEWDVSWKPTAEASMMSDLADGRCDVALARFVEDTDGITHTRPYLEHQVAAARLASGPAFPSLEFAAGRRIGARTGSIPRDWLRSNLPASAAIVSLPSTGDLVAALKASRVDSLRPTSVDAIVDDWTSLAYRSKDDPEIVLFQTVPTGMSIAMAVREDDDAMFELIDGGVEELLADGTVEDLNAELFFPDPE